MDSGVKEMIDTSKMTPVQIQQAGKALQQFIRGKGT
jgi:hypothetical protein